MKKLTKIAKCDNPLVESADTIEEYGKSVWKGLVDGIDENHLSPPVDYWVAGVIVEEPVVGKSLIMFRKIRNGETVEGVFTSSVLKKVLWTHDNKKCVLQTNNSIYILEDYKE